MEALTVKQITQIGQALDPQAAAGRINGSRKNLCTSPLITAIDDNGTIIPLQLIAGKHAAIYVRVSTDIQVRRKGSKDKNSLPDGYSVQDQIQRGISICKQRGWAFRIYSDAGMS